MLGMGRAVGETMIVLMIGGNSLQMPKNLSYPVRTLTSTIAIEMGEVSQTSLHYSALFTLGLVLFIFTFFINYLVEKVTRQKGTL
jgi:phosphate transport system permease protein